MESFSPLQTKTYLEFQSIPEMWSVNSQLGISWLTPLRWHVIWSSSSPQRWGNLHDKTAYSSPLRKGSLIRNHHFFSFANNFFSTLLPIKKKKEKEKQLSLCTIPQSMSLLARQDAAQFRNHLMKGITSSNWLSWILFLNKIPWFIWIHLHFLTQNL